MMRWRIYIILVIVLAGGAVAIRQLMPEDTANKDMFKEVYYRCANGHEITLTGEQYNQHQREHYGKLFACPECGSTDLALLERDEQTGELRKVNIRPVDPP